MKCIDCWLCFLIASLFFFMFVGHVIINYGFMSLFIGFILLVFIAFVYIHVQNEH